MREEPEELVGADWVAKYLKVSIHTTADWRSKKRGPPWRKIGKRALYLPSEVAQWVVEQTKPEPIPPPRKRSDKPTHASAPYSRGFGRFKPGRNR